MTDATEQLFGSLRVDDGHALLTLAGEVDLVTCGRFKALIDAAFAVEQQLTGLNETAAAAQIQRVTLDLSGIRYLGVCAVPVLERAAVLLRKSGGRLMTRNISPEARRLIQVSGLAAVLEQEVHQPEGEVAVVRGLAAAARIPRDRELLDAALQLVVRMVQTVLAGADGVSITLPRRGRLGTVAASNDVVLEMDHDQYDTGQGPCLDAATQGARFHIPALAAERRWPDFVPRAKQRGIASILSTPLVAAEQSIGALNIYSLTEGAFADHEKDWADTFAAEASTLVATAQAGRSGEGFDEQLLDALHSRQVIAMAQGLVIHRDGGTPAQAYEALREASSASSRPLRIVCEELVMGPVSSGRPGRGRAE